MRSDLALKEDTDSCWIVTACRLIRNYRNINTPNITTGARDVSHNTLST